MAWNSGSIEALQKERLKDTLLVIASATAPYTHNYDGDKIKALRQAGGVVTALEPILKITQGLWVAYGRGNADTVTADEAGKLPLPPQRPRYTLKRIMPGKADVRGWYYGFANQALWPLCHNVFERPLFLERDWQAYRRVNEQFAKAIAEETAGKQAVVWIQDYQLALVPSLLRKLAPQLTVGLFWHIPWPAATTFQICPWAAEILDGMLGAQLIGFQRPNFAREFLLAVGRTLQAKVDFDNMAVTYNNRTTQIKPFAVSIDARQLIKNAQQKKAGGKNYLKKFFPTKYEFLSLGVERLDYTKGLLERFRAIDRFLEKYPNYVEKFVHINVLSSSRQLIPRYEQLSRDVEELVENVNFKYRTGNWQPIHLIRRTLEPKALNPFYKNADIMMVTSLADGMNLVAKEYVAAGPDDGVLILSNQTGAADELSDALLVNPYDIERLADTIKTALELPKDDKKRRISAMRSVIENQNVWRWGGKFLNALLDTRP